MAKKEGVNYSPNTALIEGAAIAYKNWDNVSGMYTGLQELAESSADIVKESIDKKSKEIEEKNQTIKLFDNAADEVLLKSGALGQTLYDSTYDELVEAKKTYLQGIEEKDDKKRIEGLKYIQNHSAWVQEHKQFNLQLADDIKKGRLSDAHSNDEKGLDEMHNMTEIMNGNYSRTSRNDQGDVVFHIKDRQGNEKKISSTEYKDMSIFKNFEVGNAYIKGRDALLNQEIFNGEALGQALLQAMPSDKKGFRAVIHDDILGRRGGKQNLRSMLESSTTLDQEIMNAIGIEAYKEFDTDGKDHYFNTKGEKIMGLSPEEKEAFIDAVVNVDNNDFDLDVSKRIMVEQLTNAAENDHKTHWTEKNRKEQEKLERHYQQQNKERQTFNVGYGVGYVTVKSAEQLVKDIQNKSEIIEVKGRGVFKFNKTTDTYEMSTMVDGKEVMVPVSNQYILQTHGSWQEGYGRDVGEYGYLAPGVKKENVLDEVIAETEIPASLKELNRKKLEIANDKNLSIKEKQAKIKEIEELYKKQQ